MANIVVGSPIKVVRRSILNKCATLQLEHLFGIVKNDFIAVSGVGAAYNTSIVQLNNVNTDSRTVSYSVTGIDDPDAECVAGGEVRLTGARVTDYNSAYQPVQLDADAKLPALDGSQLTNIPSGSGDFPSGVKADSIAAHSSFGPSTTITFEWNGAGYTMFIRDENGNAVFNVSAGGAGFSAPVGIGSLSITDYLLHSGTLLGFYNASPVTQQTGVAVDIAAVHAALVNLGLITA